MFDPFKQAKLQNSYSSVKNVTIPEKEVTIDELKRLSGAGKVTGESMIGADVNLAARRKQYIRENNIKPGTQEWFRVMFAKPELTDENPF